MNTFLIFAIVIGFCVCLLAVLFVIVGFLSAYGLLFDEDHNSYLDEGFDK